MISSGTEGLRRLEYRQGESQCNILTDKPENLEAAVTAIKRHRAELEEYIRRAPIFRMALNPIHLDDGPEVATLMVEASRRAGVGPMAAVAGVLADLAV